jgi:hypothetical protein
MRLIVAYSIAIHACYLGSKTLTGGLGDKTQCARNFAILSVGYSISTFVGPVSVGLAIDHLGHVHAFLMLALFTLPPIIGLLLDKRFNVIGGQKSGGESRSTLELLRLPPVRSVVIISGLIVAGSDLFAFYNVARVVIPVVCGALGSALGAAPVFWLNALNLTAISRIMWRQ